VNPVEPFIKRPIATALLAIAVMLTGALGYLRLPVSALPEVDFPVIEVTTQLPGASPDTVAILITASLERQLAQIAGLEEITSVSGPGSSRITLQFALGRQIDDAALDVQAAINASRGVLPANLPYPPTYAKVNPADPPILTLALTSDTLPVTRLSDAADTLLAQRLSQVSGVGRVVVQGNMRPAIRIRADPRRLAVYGLSLEDVRQAIASTNVNTPKGNLNGPSQASAIMANDQINRPADFSAVVIAWRNNAPVKLSDVGVVVEDLENTLNAATWNGKPAVLLDVQRQPGANIVRTVADVRAQIGRLEGALPAGVRLDVVSDRTETIRASVSEVQFTLVLSVLLVVVVIWAFLRSPRATLVPAVSLPLSLIGSFGVMALCGFSLDNLSLMALTVATGFVVDDAIVMIENIVRLMEDDMGPMEAAIKGGGQIAFTILSLSISLIAVFIPLLFMPGIVGRLFVEFALTMTIAVVVSLLVSLTITPMMCGHILREAEEKPKMRLARWFEKSFDWLRVQYATSLDWSLRRRPLMLGIATLTVAATVLLYIAAPKGFLPVQDTGLIIATVEGPQDASFNVMSNAASRVAEHLRADADVATVTAIVGAGVVNPSQASAQLTAVLRPRDSGRDTAQAIAARLQQSLEALPGISVTLRPVQDIQIGARASPSAYLYTLTGPDPVELGTWSERLRQRLADHPLMRNVSTDQRDRGLRIAVNVDRDRAGRLGVTLQSVDDVLYDAFGQRQISTIYAQNNQYRVVLEASPEVLTDPAVIGLLRVPATAGQATTGQAAQPTGASPTATAGPVTQVPLSEIATISLEAGPLLVTRFGQFAAATIGFDLRPGASLGEAVRAVRAAEAEIGFPNTITGRFSGDAAEFNRSLSGETWLILAAIVVIYIVLGMLYESVIHPLTILSTLPSAGIGALLALRLAGLDLSVVGLVGIVLLMGIVKKNAIMMVDFAIEARRDHGMTPDAAIREAALLRFRPIMMTTMAALLGALPLMLAQGAGSELRTPLGIAVVGGLLLSQAVTLYTTPAIYLGMEWVREALTRRRRASAAPAE